MNSCQGSNCLQNDCGYYGDYQCPSHYAMQHGCYEGNCQYDQCYGMQYGCQGMQHGCYRMQHGHCGRRSGHCGWHHH